MSRMTEVMTANLSGEALGWMVAIAEGLTPEVVGPQYGNPHRVFVPSPSKYGTDVRYKPWEDWSQGGPLIEKLAITLTPFSMDLNGPPQYWLAESWLAGSTPQDGGSALIAACRAIVAAKLGGTVQVPKELLS